MTREEAIKWLEYHKQGEMGKAVEDLDMAIEALKQEPEPVYFPPCVDCQNRSKEILTAYNNMKKMQTFTKEELITILEKLRAEIEQIADEERKHDEKWAIGLRYAVKIIDKYKVEGEE